MAGRLVEWQPVHLASDCSAGFSEFHALACLVACQEVYSTLWHILHFSGPTKAWTAISGSASTRRARPTITMRFM